jgi:mono/diheme cytochrome c family protein
MRVLLVVAILMAPGLALAQDPADGRALAAQWCANCHRVSAAGPGPTTDAAPGFAAIATRGKSAEDIATFLRQPHAGMPDHGLTLRQAQDLAAYVLAQGVH